MVVWFYHLLAWFYVVMVAFYPRPAWFYRLVTVFYEQVGCVQTVFGACSTEGFLLLGQVEADEAVFAA